MQLMAEATERNWMDWWPAIIQTDIKSQLNMGGTYQMIAGSYMEDLM